MQRKQWDVIILNVYAELIFAISVVNKMNFVDLFI